MTAQNNNSVQDQDGNSTKPLLSSRLLKFRAFSNETKKMMDWDFIKSVNNLTKLISLNHVDVSQFTGLHDKNGKEIYEGDIVTDGVGKYKIIYDLKLAGYQPYCIFRDDPENYCEVIGNIYENPDLVKL